jgi:hypothetical protein
MIFSRAPFLSLPLSLIAIGCLACNKAAPPAGTTATTTTQAAPSKPPLTAATTPVANTPPNVQVDSVYFEHVGATPEVHQYNIDAKFKNYGPGIAEVKGSCSWTCPGSKMPDSSEPMYYNTAFVDPSLPPTQLRPSIVSSSLCTSHIPTVPVSCTFQSARVNWVGPVQTFTWQGNLPFPY